MWRILVLSLALLAAACAELKVKQVDFHGKSRLGEEEGLYVPRLKPYLLVANLPPESASSETAGAPRLRSRSSSGRAGAGSGSNPSPRPTDSSTTDNKSNATPGTTSDLSFGGLTKQYVIKLVYLPDYSHQQAIRVSPGLFATSERSAAISWRRSRQQQTGGRD
jgi:hypothetical protein